MKVTWPEAAGIILAILISGAGCLEAVPFFGPPVVYPKIVPDAGGVMPVPPVYSFKFQDFSVTVDVPVDSAVYAGARNADKRAHVFDRTIEDEEWRGGIYRSMVEDPAQDDFYDRILSRMREIKEIYALDRDEYAELLSVFVQSVPYEYQNLTSPRFPVETYVDGSGDCDDKSLLLAGLLSRENYRTALLYFDEERHMAVGIGCAGQGYSDTGYAYIETTNVSFIGVPPEELSGGLRLVSQPAVIPQGNGSFQFTACSETEALWNAVREKSAVLKTMEEEIRTREVILQAKKQELDSMKSAMEDALSGGNLPGYNSRVSAYNSLVREYNAMRAEYLGIVQDFNRQADQHNYILSHQYDRKGTYAWFSALPSG